MTQSAFKQSTRETTFEITYSINCSLSPDLGPVIDLCVCVTRSMICSQVCELVRFLIENCRKVLGDDVTSLFGAFPQKSNSSDHGSGKQSLHLFTEEITSKSKLCCTVL